MAWRKTSPQGNEQGAPRECAALAQGAGARPALRNAPLSKIEI